MADEDQNSDGYKPFEAGKPWKARWVVENKGAMENASVRAGIQSEALQASAREEPSETEKRLAEASLRQYFKGDLPMVDLTPRSSGGTLLEKVRRKIKGIGSSAGGSNTRLSSENTIRNLSATGYRDNPRDK